MISFTPFPTSHELDSRQAKESAIAVSRALEGTGVRHVHLPNHFDAIQDKRPIRRVI